MLAVLVALSLSQCGDPEGPIYSCPSTSGSRAVFDFAPTNGAGMGPACAGLIPTMTSGALSFARATPATCCKADGTCVDLISGEPAVSVCPDCSSGPLGIIAERAATNLLLRSYQLDNASWTVVGAGVVTANSFTGPFTACATAGRCTGGTDRSLEQLNDDQAGSDEGVSQAATIGTLYRYAFSCWLRSGTATSARLRIAGTGNAAGDRTCTVSGLTTTARRFACVSTASYAAGLTAITASVLVGSAAADTGTIGAGDCQLEVDNFWDPHVSVTSYVPTTTATVTRNRTQWSSIDWPTNVADGTGCAAASFYRRQYDTENPLVGLVDECDDS
jgi:hypothetical protein